MPMFTASAGTRDRLVTIEALTESTGGSGFPIETWAPLRQAWMARDDVRGDERFAAGELSTRYDTRWLVPYAADLDPEALNVPKVRRLSYLGRVYDIVSAGSVGWHVQIELLTIAQG